MSEHTHDFNLATNYRDALVIAYMHTMRDCGCGCDCAGT